MTRPTIGTPIDGGAALPIDVERLMVSRLLIEATSGGGKTYTIRRLLEQTHGLVPHLVVDVEDDFPTLRERFDYVLAAPSGGDCVADPRSAGLLGRRLVAMGASAILSIHDLRPVQRVAFVKNLLRALLDAPRKEWRPCMVVIDEAQLFCPEKGAGQADSAEDVVDLMTRGRKRGLCGVLATLRPAALDLNARAAAQNKLVGLCTADVDIKRCGTSLGIASFKEAQEKLSHLQPGEFWAMGPAFSRAPQLIKVGKVVTTHPEPGMAPTTPPPPPARVRKMLADLGDLPKEAEEEARTLAQAMERIRQLESEIKAKPTPPTVTPPVKIQVVPVVKNEQVKRLEGIVSRMEKFSDGLSSYTRDLVDGLARVSAAADVVVHESPPVARPRTERVMVPLAVYPGTGAATVATEVSRRIEADVEDAAISATAQRTLDTIVMLLHRGISVNRESVARWQGLHPKGSRFVADLSTLERAGLLDGLAPTSEGTARVRSVATGIQPALDAAGMKDASRRRQLEELILATESGERLSREELAKRLSVHPKGSRFVAGLSWLRAMGVIPESGDMYATPAVFR